MAYPTYTPEQIQEFKTKDLRIHKSGIIKSYVEAFKELPKIEWVDKAIALIYNQSEKEKQIINPNYVPNTETGEPFESSPPNKKKDDKDSLNNAITEE